MSKSAKSAASDASVSAASVSAAASSAAAKASAAATDAYRQTSTTTIVFTTVVITTTVIAGILAAIYYSGYADDILKAMAKKFYVSTPELISQPRNSLNEPERFDLFMS